MRAMQTSNEQNSLIKTLILCVTMINAKNCLYCSMTMLQYKSIINAFVIVVCFVLYVKTVLFNKEIKIGHSVLFSLALAIVFLFQFLLFPANTPFVMNMIPIFIMYGLFPYLLTVSVIDFHTTNQYLLFSAIATFLVALFALLLVTIEGNSISLEYNMPFGNTLSFSAIIIFAFVFIKRKWYLVLVFLSECLMILMVGSRGPLLSLSAFVFLYLIQYWRPKKKYYKALLLTVFFTLVIAVLINFEYVLQLLEVLIERLGFHSRTLDMVAAAKIFNLSGRDYIYETCREFISMHPFLGIGIEGLQGQGYINWSPHNLFYELVLSFGIPVGSIIIIALVLLYTKGVFFCSNQDLKLFNLIMFSQYVPRCIFGAGLFENSWFWLLLGGCVNYLISQTGSSSLGFRIRGIVKADEKREL